MPDATHVIIQGHVFTREEKAPFVPSGMSFLGAAEYDKERDVLRCHECGEWYKGVGSHVLDAHGMTLADYKSRHGLRQSTSLLCMASRAKISRNNAKTGNRRNITPRVPGTVTKNRRPRVDMESRNKRGACQAQILFKIQMLAAKVGRTPSITELDSIGLRQPTCQRAFGWIPMTSIIEMAGLKPNPRGPTFTGPTKPKAKSTERMPWPADYFTTPPKSATPLSGR